MHHEAYQGVAASVAEAQQHGLDLSLDLVGLDVGGQDVNGTARDLFPGVTWHALDLYDENADYQVDARSFVMYGGTERYDLVLSTEVLEHVRWWPLVVRTMFDALRPGGFVFITAAAPPRGPHSAQGLPTKPADEWYENVNPDELRALVEEVFQPQVVRHAYRANPGDVYLWARK